MYDSWGDGWNGNIMNIDGDGTNGGTGILTIAMGSEATHIVGTCDDDPVEPTLCEACADAGGFYCGDDESNWTSYSPNGCVRG